MHRRNEYIKISHYQLQSFGISFICLLMMQYLLWPLRFWNAVVMSIQNMNSVFHLKEYQVSAHIPFQRKKKKSRQIVMWQTPGRLKHLNEMLVSIFRVQVCISNLNPSSFPSLHSGEWWKLKCLEGCYVFCQDLEEYQPRFSSGLKCAPYNVVGTTAMKDSGEPHSKDLLRLKLFNRISPFLWIQLWLFMGPWGQ